MNRSDSVARLLLTVLFAYLFSVGATYNGVLIPELSFFTLGVMALLVVVWWVVRWRSRWQWHRTPLDAVLVLWGAAFGLALLANLDVWRRILMGLWYVGVYVGVWYALHDAMANRAIKRAVIVDAFLMASLVVVSFGYIQLSLVEPNAPLPRLVSLIGNPNTFGGFLVVLLSLLLGRLMSVQDRLGRLVVVLYSLLTAPLLLLTLSRGALLGMAFAGVAFIWLVLQSWGISSARQLRTWWLVQSHPVRVVMNLVMLVVAVLLTGTVFVLIQRTFVDSGGDLRLRQGIYGSALTAFAEQPITGHGLFTFGQQLGRLQSQPADQPHSHAHNILLHIAAELGLVGLAALAVTLVVLGMVILRNWRTTPQREKPLLAGVLAALSGFAVAHQFDVLSMMPVIALVGLIMLVIATAPHEPQPLQAQWRRIGHPVGMASLWVLLLISGFWSTSIYAQYNQAIRYGVLESAFREGAERLQPVVEADPALALYHSQQGYLYAVAAAEGDDSALPLGIAAYERYLELEPYDSIAMTNLAALYWQAGEMQTAIALMERALFYAPNAWQYLAVLGEYAEAAGELELATRTYKSWLRNSYNLMDPRWQETDFRQQLASAIKPRGIAGLILALDANAMETEEEAAYLWENSDLEGEQSARRYVLRLIFEQQTGISTADSQQAQLSQAQSLAMGALDNAWVEVGRAAVLEAAGGSGADHIAAAQVLLAPDFAREDYLTGLNIAHFQFLRYAIARQYIPQVPYVRTEVLAILPFLS
ncbi:MAG: hypothetical protein OHK0046_02770 [Anaerolineae bacterium]